jgi:hypothetical protein
MLFVASISLLSLDQWHLPSVDAERGDGRQGWEGATSAEAMTPRSDPASSERTTRSNLNLPHKFLQKGICFITSATKSDDIDRLMRKSD